MKIIYYSLCQLYENINKNYFSKYQTNFDNLKQHDKDRIKFSTLFRMSAHFKI